MTTLYVTVDERNCADCGTPKRRVGVRIDDFIHLLSVEDAVDLRDALTLAIRTWYDRSLDPHPADFVPLKHAMSGVNVAARAGADIHWFVRGLQVLSGVAIYPGYRREILEPICDGEWLLIKDGFGS